ncbi:Threonine dehydratase biosynthetic, chloroplastic [Nowakowskiella sp. JEL0407]|nr:Threonine dehydratase biosynthetic, chloroplastic [Nowakowskiella sp. JEL0407]
MSESKQKEKRPIIKSNPLNYLSSKLSKDNFKTLQNVTPSDNSGSSKNLFALTRSNSKSGSSSSTSSPVRRTFSFGNMTLSRKQSKQNIDPRTSQTKTSDVTPTASQIEDSELKTTTSNEATESQVTVLASGHVNSPSDSTIKATSPTITNGASTQTLVTDVANATTGTDLSEQTDASTMTKKIESVSQSTMTKEAEAAVAHVDSATNTEPEGPSKEETDTPNNVSHQLDPSEATVKAHVNVSSPTTNPLPVAVFKHPHHLKSPSTPPIAERPQAIFVNPSAGKHVPRSDGTPEPDYLTLILTAKVYDVAIESPLVTALNLSAKLKNTVLLKREDLQPVFSFKLRGAYNRMQQLSAEEREKGVIACSAGNHAQGVALSAKKMGIKATIVMPLATPPIKWKNVQRLGAEVLLHGNDFDEAKTECNRLCDEMGLTNIPPYDDPYVIAGQGTIGVELARQMGDKEIDAIFLCVGGGGLIAGVASYIKRLYPNIKIIGVEAYDANAMTESLKQGKRVFLDEVGLFADGAAVRNVGEETFRICQELIDEMVLVTTDEICAAIKDTFEDSRSIIEPAGALGVAGIKKYVAENGLEGKNFVAVTSGANMNFDRLRFVAERADIGENTEALITVIVPEEPGSFMKLYQAVHPRAVTGFSYRYSDPKNAHIIMSFRVVDRQVEMTEIINQLSKLGYRVMDVTHSEMAKAHVLHLVGGRGKDLANERLFRFTFPERPGALQHFLGNLKSTWNVSLFHYRNYGGDVGKVMVGIQVPEETSEEFEEFLNHLKYPFVEETANPVYQQFLR